MLTLAEHEPYTLLSGTAPTVVLGGGLGYTVSMRNLISVPELQQALQQPHKLVIFDTRFNLNEPAAGEKLYRAGHIPGAHFLDLDRDLSSTPQTHGGRHPLPDMAAFADTLAAHGVSNDSRVVVYDADSGVFAGRLWWMLKYLGHDDVQLLDGGYAAWCAAGLEISQELPTAKAAAFTVRLRSEMLVDMATVRARLEDDPEQTLLIDARAPERYRGDHEPLDPQAGHIPSARNKFFGDNLEQGHFKPEELLEQQFSEAHEHQEVIVYCGSGVSAAHNVLVLDALGVPNVRLYVGSWSDWSSHPDNPIATGDDS